MTRIRKDDMVKVIAGSHKGTTGKVLAVAPAKGVALVEGIGLGHRHVKPNQLNPRGGKKDIHVGVSLHKLALIADEKTSKTSRVGYKKTEAGKVRVARQIKDKEIK
ncbi:MAG: 50S ribosomal protein L24 [Candidatus Saccharimonas sp.]|jgi:large subunit ribosomal protein L24|nr:50S ribosomal protein L24 [Candidatus Saccharimonas sp.]